jgi:hypothetical protein
MTHWHHRTGIIAKVNPLKEMLSLAPLPNRCTLWIRLRSSSPPMEWHQGYRIRRSYNTRVLSRVHPLAGTGRTGPVAPNYLDHISSVPVLGLVGRMAHLWPRTLGRFCFLRDKNRLHWSFANLPDCRHTYLRTTNCSNLPRAAPHARRMTLIPSETTHV